MSEDSEEKATAEGTDGLGRAVELLQELGLKEYEATCLAVLSGLSEATAREISERSAVPRTRVYDAVRVLEARGLVEVQHTNPQRFRAVPVDEAVDILRRQYGSRFDELRTTLKGLDTSDGESTITHEVWSMTGADAIASRTLKLVEEAESEVVFVAGDGSVVDPELIDGLSGRDESGVSVVLGGASEAVERRLRGEVAGAETFLSGLEWLHGSDAGDETAVGRLLLVDRGTILVSTLDADGTERAVFGRGFANGLVVVLRRLMATGLSGVDGGDGGGTDAGASGSENGS
jgi:predicted transcriptional regulator